MPMSATAERETKTEPPKKLQFVILAVLISALAFITFYHLGSRPLIDYDESIYAQVAQESFQNGNQLGFTWLGNIALHRTEMWFEKPPLMIWLMESSYLVFGVNEFAARFWTAVFAVLTAALVFFFVKKLSQSFAAAILAVAAFFIAFQFSNCAGVLQLDIPVGFFVLLALFSFWQAKEQSRFYFLFWAALGFGVMIKSVIGLLPLPITFIFSMLAKDFGWLKDKKFQLGVLLFLAIVLPWHIAESVCYGKEFWRQYLFYHLLERYSSTLEGNGGSSFFYFDIIFKQGILFWSLMLSLVYFIARSFKSKKHLFVTTAVLFIFLFFSAAGTKLPPYILVIYPFAAMMIGMTLADLSKCLERLRKNSSNIFIATTVFIFMFAGFENDESKLAGENDPQLSSDKAVGEFLKINCPGQPVYYYSANSTRFSIIFYSNRVVGYLSDYPRSRPHGRFVLISTTSPDFQNKTILFTTASEKIYQIE
jgi:4-amino-4-deoxy-L-arabinose transferase-like glycosyltransferase